MSLPPLASEPSPDSLRDRLGQNDTRAYLEAQVLFTETQRRRADEIASRYREALYDWQEYLKQHSPPAP